MILHNTTHETRSTTLTAQYKDIAELWDPPLPLPGSPGPLSLAWAAFFNGLTVATLGLTGPQGQSWSRDPMINVVATVARPEGPRRGDTGGDLSLSR